MLGFLLITCKNGRQLKTYGVNRLEVYNMKFTFICIVTVISCSVCVLGDLEIYPGVKYGSQIRRAIPSDTEDEQTLYESPYSGWNWQKSDDYSDNDGNYNIRKFPNLNHDIAEFLRRQMENARDETRRLHQRQRIREAYEYGNLERDLGNFGPYRHINRNTPVLDDVRMYPQEDDFMFKDDDEDENANEQTTNKILYNEENTKKYLKQIEKVLDDVQDHMMDHNMDEEDTSPTNDATSKKFKNVPFVKDPTEFAYAPPDPRFYLPPSPEATQGPVPLIKPKSDPNAEENIGKLKVQNFDDKFNIQSRSGDKNREIATEHMVLTTDQLHRTSPDVLIRPSEESPRVYIIAIVAGISAAATVGLIAVGIGWYNLQKHVKNASDVEYPAYGITGPNKDTSPSGDRRLAQSAQMYHYQHQKQQILAMENRATATDRHGSVSEADSEEENEEGDYTVYECPGLAPTGEMEVKNPMFQDDPTPAQTPPVKVNNADPKK